MTENGINQNEESSLEEEPRQDEVPQQIEEFPYLQKCEHDEEDDLEDGETELEKLSNYDSRKDSDGIYVCAKDSDGINEKEKKHERLIKLQGCIGMDTVLLNWKYKKKMSENPEIHKIAVSNLISVVKELDANMVIRTLNSIEVSLEAQQTCSKAVVAKSKHGIDLVAPRDKKVKVIQAPCKSLSANSLELQYFTLKSALCLKLLSDCKKGNFTYVKMVSKASQSLGVVLDAASSEAMFYMALAVGFAKYNPFIIKVYAKRLVRSDLRILDLGAIKGGSQKRVLAIRRLIFLIKNWDTKSICYALRIMFQELEARRESYLCEYHNSPHLITNNILEINELHEMCLLMSLLKAPYTFIPLAKEIQGWLVNEKFKIYMCSGFNLGTWMEFETYGWEYKKQISLDIINGSEVQEMSLLKVLKRLDIYDGYKEFTRFKELSWTAFVPWLVVEHNKRNFEQQWLSLIFSNAVFLGNDMAIRLSGFFCPIWRDLSNFSMKLNLNGVKHVPRGIIKFGCKMITGDNLPSSDDQKPRERMADHIYQSLVTLLVFVDVRSSMFDIVVIIADHVLFRFKRVLLLERYWFIPFPSQMFRESLLGFLYGSLPRPPEEHHAFTSISLINDVVIATMLRQSIMKSVGQVKLFLATGFQRQDNLSLLLIMAVHIILIQSLGDDVMKLKATSFYSISLGPLYGSLSRPPENTHSGFNNILQHHEGLWLAFGFAFCSKLLKLSHISSKSSQPLIFEDKDLLNKGVLL